MEFSRARGFVEHIRRDTFGIGDDKPNPLATMLHESIVHLSAELYQKDIHFISELLQNAEDNVYDNTVIPSLEILLTPEDITHVGAPFTLILLNNEAGFQPEHVQAMCSVGHSTKKGKRQHGYIGEKGIGFKSVFLVTQSPFIVSNGYRIKFSDKVNEASIGYIVPEWVDVPTDADLSRIYGSSKQLPQTIIILPLRSDKVNPVRQQLKHISPETLLFLSKLRQLSVRDSNKLALCIKRSDVTKTTVKLEEDQDCKSMIVNLSIGKTLHKTPSEESQYYLVQQRFPVTNTVEQRKEVKHWYITLAFPVAERILSNTSNIGDIFAFLPSTVVSGFPFIINADFLLVSSRETLKFDNPWNIGILSCLPQAFLRAFDMLLHKSDDRSGTSLSHAPIVEVQHAYRYVPTQVSPNAAQLQHTQKRILQELINAKVILIDTRVGHKTVSGYRQFCKTGKARQILPDFRKILEASRETERPHPLLNKKRPSWYVVDCVVQEQYLHVLESLKVPAMTSLEYAECLTKSDWLMGLEEDLYWEVVRFVFMNLAEMEREMSNIPLLKYCKQDGSGGLELASISNVKSAQGVKIYTAPDLQCEWLVKWTSVLKTWVPVYFVPEESAKSLKQCKLKTGISSDTAFSNVIGELSIMGFAERLLEVFRSSKDFNFIVLTTEFIYQCIQNKTLSLDGTLRKLKFFLCPIVDACGVIHKQPSRINMKSRASLLLLPSYGSSWPTLEINSWFSQSVICMSNAYVTPPTQWPEAMKSCMRPKDKPVDLDTFRFFLQELVWAVDLPHITPSPNTGAIPDQLLQNLSPPMDKILLKWLEYCLPYCQDPSYQESCGFFKSLKESKWLLTEQHWKQKPSSCFLRGEFSVFFADADIPFLHPSLVEFRETLKFLGLVTTTGDSGRSRGCQAIASYFSEVSNRPTPSADFDIGRATRFYSYLQKNLWNGVCAQDISSSSTSQKLKIFIPLSKDNISSTSSWMDSKSCVIYKGKFYDENFTVLDDLYPSDLLPFFSEVLQVPTEPSVEKYCELWLSWRANVYEVTADQCEVVWSMISQHWKNCDPTVWNTFLGKAWVPLMPQVTLLSPSKKPKHGSVEGVLQLSSPSTCVISDDLYIHDVFAASSELPRFVWYPNDSEEAETALNEVYALLGVKNLSQSVVSNFEFHDQLSLVGPSTTVACTRDVLRPGLFRAILGFLCIRKFDLRSDQRQELIKPLTKAVEVTIKAPFLRSYALSAASSSMLPIQETNVMVYWAKSAGKLYYLAKDNQILQNSLIARDFRAQLASTIANGLLHQHQAIAIELAEFLKLLVECGFEQSHVEFELKLRNGKLYGGDESFLRELF